MSELRTIADIISLWPQRADLVSDINEAARAPIVSIHQVNKWAETGSVRSKFLAPILRAAQARGFAVTADDLVRLTAADPGETRGEAA